MNVILREIDEQDIEKIRIWRNSDVIQNVSYNRNYISEDDQKIWFEYIKTLKSQIHWVININGHDAGYAAIKNIDLKNQRCEFASLYIGEAAFLLNGSGAIAEFKVIEYIYSEFRAINKIFCEVLDFNKKVIQLHKRFGFIIEGELKNHYYIDKRYHSVILLALFKDKWLETKPVLEKILIR